MGDPGGIEDAMDAGTVVVGTLALAADVVAVDGGGHGGTRRG
jgi:hypothetical protein